MEAAAKLDAFAAGDQHAVISGTALREAKLAFVFSGNGAQWPEMAREGGLIGYGPSIVQLYRDVQSRQLTRLLRGAKPADIPVEQPTRFELVVNVKTAKALGLAVPQSVLARADEVIE